MSGNPSDGPEFSKPRLDTKKSEPVAPAERQRSDFIVPRPPTAFYSPPPAAEQPPPAKRSRLLVAAVAVVVAIGIGIGTWQALKPSPPDPIPAVTATKRAEKAFLVSKTDLDQKATDYLKAFLSGKSSDASKADTSDASTSTSAADPLHAVNAPALKALAKTSPKLAEEIKSGRCVLYRVYLLDFLEEDDDHVELSVDGISHGDLYLKNAGTEILIPLIAGVPAQMKLLATQDGGGGVTVGFISSLGEARTRVMQVSESEEWQVTVQ